MAFFICFLIYVYRTFGEDAVEVNSANADIDGVTTESNNLSSGLDSEDLQNMAEDDERNASPSIQIDLSGYQVNDEKTAFFDKGSPQDAFLVVNADTKETVYRGFIDQKRRGDFSQVKKCGTYYIEASHIGRSYSFEITKDKYKKMSVALYEKVLAYANKDTNDFEHRVQILAWILRYAGMYPETKPYSVFYSGQAETETPQYLKDCSRLADDLADKAAGLREDGDISTDTLAVYSAAMSMMYDRLLPYDSSHAGMYLNEAVTAYDIIDDNMEDLSDEAFLFYASAELYQSTGQSKYQRIAEDFLENTEERKLFVANSSREQLYADEAYVYGMVAYLNTTNIVHLDLCDKSMKCLMRAAETFDTEIQSNHYDCVSSDERSRLLTDRLYVISVVEHVIVSQEYNNILKNAIHYLGGCNDQKLSLLTEEGVYHAELDDKGSDAVNGSAYFYLLGQICESDYKEKESIRSEAMESEEQ